MKYNIEIIGNINIIFNKVTWTIVLIIYLLYPQYLDGKLN